MTPVSPTIAELAARIVQLEETVRELQATAFIFRTVEEMVDASVQRHPSSRARKLRGVYQEELATRGLAAEPAFLRSVK